VGRVTAGPDLRGEVAGAIMASEPGISFATAEQYALAALGAVVARLRRPTRAMAAACVRAGSAHYVVGDPAEVLARVAEAMRFDPHQEETMR
jgi:hypothetical protein